MMHRSKKSKELDNLVKPFLSTPVKNYLKDKTRKADECEKAEKHLEPIDLGMPKLVKSMNPVQYQMNGVNMLCKYCGAFYNRNLTPTETEQVQIFFQEKYLEKEI